MKSTKLTVNADKAPDAPLLDYISSSKTYKEIAKDHNLTYATIQNRATRENWKEKRHIYVQKQIAEMTKRNSHVLLRQIESLKTLERQQITSAIDQLEQSRVSLTTEIDNCPDLIQAIKLKASLVRQLLYYADARYKLQSALYRSYGIDRAESAGGNVSLVFNAYPQNDDVVDKYRQIVDITPPRQANHPPVPDRHTTSSDVRVVLDHSGDEICSFPVYDEGMPVCTDEIDSEVSADNISESISPIGKEDILETEGAETGSIVGRYQDF